MTLRIIEIGPLFHVNSSSANNFSRYKSKYLTLKYKTINLIRIRIRTITRNSVWLRTVILNSYFTKFSYLTLFIFVWLGEKIYIKKLPANINILSPKHWKVKKLNCFRKYKTRFPSLFAQFFVSQIKLLGKNCKLHSGFKVPNSIAYCKSIPDPNIFTPLENVSSFLLFPMCRISPYPYVQKSVILLNFVTGSS